MRFYRCIYLSRKGEGLLGFNMIRTELCQRVFDSSADPYITQKGVILCRSGIQMYHKSELNWDSLGTPKEDKEWYREYRPANVIVKAKDLCKALPVTKEHPVDWVTPDNWKELAGGTTGNEVEVVALDGESEGEIGLQSDITFYDRDLYNYYEEGNHEDSLGYTCKKHLVDNPDEVGYDIILDEITEVNHLAITKAGRGGSSVAVIDSIIGGLKPMRTGIFAWLAKQKQKDSAHVSFGAQVMEALKASKGETEEELAKEMQGVMDSLAVCKDSEGKATLIDTVKDCFDNKEKALANEEELTKALDSIYVNVSGDSLEEIAKAFKAVTGNADKKTLDTEPTKDSESEKEEEKEENKDSESSEKKDEENKDGCNKDEKEEEDKNKDSLAKPLTKEDVEAIVKDSVKDAVAIAVKEALGMANKDSMPEGIEIDTNKDSAVDNSYDYSSFLDK